MTDAGFTGGWAPTADRTELVLRATKQLEKTGFVGWLMTSGASQIWSTTTPEAQIVNAVINLPAIGARFVEVERHFEESKAAIWDECLAACKAAFNDPAEIYGPHSLANPYRRDSADALTKES